MLAEIGVDGIKYVLSATDEVVEGLHGFFGLDGVVVTVDLEKVDVVHLQPLQGRVDSCKDGSAGESCSSPH